LSPFLAFLASSEFTFFTLTEQIFKKLFGGPEIGILQIVLSFFGILFRGSGRKVATNRPVSQLAKRLSNPALGCFIYFFSRHLVWWDLTKSKAFLARANIDQNLQLVMKSELNSPLY